MSDFGSPFGGGFDFMFRIFPFLFVLVFVIVIGVIIYSAVNHFKNSRSPKESSFARIVSKRTDIRHHTNHHNGGSGTAHAAHSSRTYYYITLEFDSGLRKEYLDVKYLYGLVAEGDTGYAAIQGDWIIAFERNSGQ